MAEIRNQASRPSFVGGNHHQDERRIERDNNKEPPWTRLNEPKASNNADDDASSGIIEDGSGASDDDILIVLNKAKKKIDDLGRISVEPSDQAKRPVRRSIYSRSTSDDSKLRLGSGDSEESKGSDFHPVPWGSPKLDDFKEDFKVLCDCAEAIEKISKGERYEMPNSLAEKRSQQNPKSATAQSHVQSAKRKLSFPEDNSHSETVVKKGEVREPFPHENAPIVMMKASAGSSDPTHSIDSNRSSASPWAKSGTAKKTRPDSNSNSNYKPEINDLVFAAFPGYDPWPAIVSFPPIC